MKLLFGLGNPEETYTGTRHNVGFALMDAQARKHQAEFQLKNKFKALVAEYSEAEEKVLLVKPVTYYNQVGQSLHAIADFYKLDPSDVLVVHDDLALPLGVLRSRIGGSDAGNNGIKSVNQHGGETTNRLRIGIATEKRQLVGDSDFVLGRFSNEETQLLAETITPKAIELMEAFIASQHEPTSHTLA